MSDIADKEPTDHQIKIGKHVSEAAESFARRHTAGLVLFVAENDVSVGSATCVRIGNRFLLATVAHNLSDGLESESIRVVAPMSTSEEWLPISAKGWGADRRKDLGWLEIPETVAAASGLTFLDVDMLCPFEEPSDQSLYLAEGLPAKLSTVSGRTISLASLGYLTIPIEEGFIKHDYDPKVDLVLDYDHAEYPLPVPKGMSGGGVWRIQGELNPIIWAPENSRLVGIGRDWMTQSKRLIATKIEHWLGLIYQDFSDLRPIIGPMLEGRNSE